MIGLGVIDSTNMAIKSKLLESIAEEEEAKRKEAQAAPLAALTVDTSQKSTLAETLQKAGTPIIKEGLLADLPPSAQTDAPLLAPTAQPVQPAIQPAPVATAPVVPPPVTPPPAVPMATLVRGDERIAVPIGSQEAQQKFGEGFTLEGQAPVEPPPTAPPTEPPPAEPTPEPTLEDTIASVLERFGLETPDPNRDPVTQAVNAYKDVYTQLGLPTVKTRYDEVFSQFEVKSQELADAVSDVNENPWLTEGVRRGKINDLTKRFELKTAALTGQMAIYQDILDGGQREAEFIAGQISQDRLLDRAERSDLFDKAIEAISPSGDDATDDIQEFLFAKEQGFTGDFLDFTGQKESAGKSNTKLDTIDGRRVIVDMTSGEIVRDLGSAKDMDESDTKKLLEANRIARTIENVVENVDESLAFLEQAKGTGAVGRAFAQFWPGSDTRDMKETIESIKGNLGFDRLKQMRDNSPTGGAVGQLSDRELRVLSSTIENLDVLQSTDLLRRNLNKVRDFYTAWEDDLRAVGQLGLGLGEEATDLSTPDFNF